jgi:alcohol dehydrogenase
VLTLAAKREVPPRAANRATMSGGLVTHRFKLDQIEEAYDLFAHQRDGVLKVAITP